jgi:SPP1 gp7 family putative phage head morphogenesis protein
MTLKTNQKATRQEQDPTNQAGTRARATRDNNQRLNNAARKILAAWRDVDAKKTTRKKIINELSSNETLDFYVYDLTSRGKEDLFVEISDSVNEELETAEVTPPFDWYYQQYIETAYRGGTIQENAEIAVLLALVVGSITIETASILSSSQYLDLLKAAVNKNYPLFKGLSETTSKQVFQVITDGIDAGLSKSAIRRKIIERFEVAKSSAKRIVDTEVNRAYNNARTDLIKFYRDNGEPLAVQHISALLKTTRINHAARHGRVYTPEQQDRWWAEGSNRINCKCSIRAIVVNRDGTVANKAAQNKVIERGKEIFEG